MAAISSLTTRSGQPRALSGAAIRMLGHDVDGEPRGSAIRSRSSQGTSVVESANARSSLALNSPSSSSISSRALVKAYWDDFAVEVVACSINRASAAI
jgi:hypothetical protein